MSDSIQLSGDIYHAAGEKPRPTLVARTPYNKNTAEHQHRAEEYAEHGYNFVWMDVRGRGDSAGEFIPWRNEGADGFDSVEWVARRPWCDGRVVTWGESYLGHIQWLAALRQPPHLTAMIIYVAPSDPFEDSPTGIPTPWEICWLRMLDGRVLQYVDGVDWPSIAWHLPLISMDHAAGFHSEHWRTYLTQPITNQLFWDAARYQPRILEVSVPVLHITGWYDDVQRGTMTNFTRLTSPEAPESIRKQQWLIVGPWDHRCTTVRNRTLGAIDFGKAAEVDLPKLEREWLGHILDGAPSPPHVRIFVMGTNVWRAEQAWPLPATEWAKYYLQSQGDANTKHGGGKLVREVELLPERGYDVFAYDPTNPVPFLSDFASSSQIGGPDDYSEVEERTDVLVYSTEPLELDTEVTGPILLVLYASSTAVDTDFTAKLLDVHPSGFAQRLCDGMVRARFRAGYGQEPRELIPNEVECFHVDMWCISHVFSAGHQIRLEVSSSAFPKYDRSLNTGEPMATRSEMVTAVNSVWHDSRHSSHLVLPEAHTDG